MSNKFMWQVGLSLEKIQDGTHKFLDIAPTVVATSEEGAIKKATQVAKVNYLDWTVSVKTVIKKCRY